MKSKLTWIRSVEPPSLEVMAGVDGGFLLLPNNQEYLCYWCFLEVHLPERSADLRLLYEDPLETSLGFLAVSFPPGLL